MAAALGGRRSLNSAGRSGSALPPTQPGLDAAAANGVEHGGGDPTRQETRDDVRTFVGGDTTIGVIFLTVSSGLWAPTTAVVGRHFARGEHANGPSAITCSTVAAESRGDPSTLFSPA